MFTEPIGGWREAKVRERRTKVDWAQEVARLLEGCYADCEKVILACDNLNTHTPGTLYEAFTTARARSVVRSDWTLHAKRHYTNDPARLRAEILLENISRELLKAPEIAVLMGLDVEKTVPSLEAAQAALAEGRVDDAKQMLALLQSRQTA